jgi:hypothetical protein
VDISIYNATAVAPSLIEERASLVDGNEVDTGDDVMADGSENLMLKLKFLPYKVQSQLPMSQYRTCNVLLAINQGPREFEGLALYSETWLYLTQA